MCYNNVQYRFIFNSSNTQPETTTCETNSSSTETETTNCDTSTQSVEMQTEGGCKYLVTLPDLIFKYDILDFAIY